MTFLPIVDRELRAAARRRSTYWSRLTIALFAVLAEIIIYVGGLSSPAHLIGRDIFAGLSILCLGYCVLAGRISTADCLSEEKREGTLGLLFLTDLKGYDIVLGKLVSTSLSGLYSLLAVMPVLALPLLLGGITSGEFWRVVLVLVNTFFFSLAIGMFGSAISRDARRTMAANFALSLFLFVVLPLALYGATYLVTGSNLGVSLGSSPFCSFYLSEDTLYKLYRNGFWASSLVVAAQSLILLALASRVVRGAWQDKPVAAPRARQISWNGFWRLVNYGKYARLAAFRKELLDQNAFYWLASRARLKPLHVWIFLQLAALWWLVNFFFGGDVQHEETGLLCTILALMVNCTFKCWIAQEAGRQLAEDQKAGAMELLLATPLTDKDIVRGQLLALRRQFLTPFLVALGVEVILIPLLLGHVPDRAFNLDSVLAGIVMLVADVVALPFVAMRAALTAKNPARAVLETAGKVLALPWLVLFIGGGLFTVFVEFFQGINHPDESSVYLALWFWGGLAADLFFGLRAWRQLNGHFRELALWRYAPPKVRAPRRLRLPVWLKKRKRPALAGAVVLVMVFAFFALREAKPDYPPPLDVSIIKSNGPVRLFPGFPTYIVLPDQSLWRWGSGGYGYGGNRAAIRIPERIGTNAGWAQASAVGENNVMLRNDGTVWALDESGDPLKQVDAGRDWISVSTGTQFTVGIKKDGTLWGWPANYFRGLAKGARVDTNYPFQASAESGWIDVICKYNCTLALRTNGTLWVWGQTWSQQTGIVNFSNLTLACNASNWVGFAGGIAMSPLAWNTSGELWQLTPALADPEVSATVIGQVIASNTIAGRFAEGVVGYPAIFEIRPNGTLWEKPFSLAQNYSVSPDDPWTQVGRRSDWQKLWNSNLTVFGLTADGTLWTWGLDPTRTGKWTFSAELQMVGRKIKEVLSSNPGSPPNNFGPPMAIQKAPRPLLHLNYGH